ncbi:neuropeptide CCHamide-2 receptor-like isoform X2 [Maniola jurtina]|uniref:neuropeptide CCHamide-2 receptor-like isoform X2 n=1 Tax=Maniola jurtina TaxID=191418 RepID=UPI001E688BBA|nr:neuropeptide CCHamide-2 receptor-like isoform X2 [Maniola jurtina]
MHTNVNSSALVYDNSSDSGYTPYSDRIETYLVPVIFALIFIVGVLGNGTLVIVYIRHRGMRNAPNTYIFSLALADLLVILICVPFVSVIYTLESWPWGEAICRISETGKDISIGVSVFTLTALSAERYCAIVNPFRKLQLRKLPLVCATIIWAAALIFAAPAALFSSTITHDIDNNVSIIYCSPYPETWDNYAKWMTLSKAIIYYALPLLVIAFFYSLMAQRLLASTREMPGALHGGQGEAQAKARKSVACMVLIFVIVFFICFLPYHALEVWFYLSPTAQTDYNDFIHALRIIAFCLRFLNSCVNPIALCSMSDVYKKYFIRYVCCKKDVLQPTHSLRLMKMNCETGVGGSQRHTFKRNPTESIVISNYDYGSTKKKNNIILRNSTDGVTIMTVRDSNDFMNDVNEKRIER